MSGDYDVGPMTEQLNSTRISDPVSQHDTRDDQDQLKEGADSTTGSKEDVNDNKAGQSEKLSEAAVTVNISINTNAVGLLIGKGGSTLKNISQISGCMIRLQSFEDTPEAVRERGVCIMGTAHAIKVAIRLILCLLQKNLPSLQQRREREKQLLARLKSENPEIVLHAEGTSMTSTINEHGLEDILLKWMISQQTVGLLIGKNGVGIKHINQKSGAWVKVAHPEESVVEGFRVVYIRGTRVQASTALAMVKKSVGGSPYIEEQVENRIREEQEELFIPRRAVRTILKGFHWWCTLTDAGEKVKTSCELAITTCVAKEEVSSAFQANGDVNGDQGSFDETGAKTWNVEVEVTNTIFTGVTESLLYIHGDPEDRLKAAEELRRRINDWHASYSSPTITPRKTDEDSGSSCHDLEAGVKMTEEMCVVILLDSSKARKVFDIQDPNSILNVLAASYGCVIQTHLDDSLCGSKSASLKRIAVTASLRSLCSIISRLSAHIFFQHPHIIPELPVQLYTGKGGGHDRNHDRTNIAPYARGPVMQSSPTHGGGNNTGGTRRNYTNTQKPGATGRIPPPRGNMGTQKEDALSPKSAGIQGNMYGGQNAYMQVNTQQMPRGYMDGDYSPNMSPTHQGSGDRDPMGGHMNMMSQQGMQYASNHHQQQQQYARGTEYYTDNNNIAMYMPQMNPHMYYYVAPPRPGDIAQAGYDPQLSPSNHHHQHHQQHQQHQQLRGKHHQHPY